MNFREELLAVLPEDLPNRERVVDLEAQHLDLIVEANRQMNLTRIVDPREAAIKHVLDSVLPWRLFAGAERVLDAGSGAGFPGVPLALVLPSLRWTLAESVGKKARFLEATVRDLAVPNVEVACARAEDILPRGGFDLITARALAPLDRAVGWFAPAIKRGARALLYKGPDAETEIAEAAAQSRRSRVAVRLLQRYELPGRFGARAIVEMANADHPSLPRQA